MELDGTELHLAGFKTTFSQHERTSLFISIYLDFVPVKAKDIVTCISENLRFLFSRE